MPELVLHAAVGVALSQAQPELALALYLGVNGILRTIELRSIRAADLTFEENMKRAHINLGLTKGGQRRGVKEDVTVEAPWLVRALRALTLHLQPGDCIWKSSDYQFQRQFRELWHVLGLQEAGFKPYSLRRTGATLLFRRTAKLDWVAERGHWAHQTTCRVYINDGLALLRELKVPQSHRSRVTHYAASAQRVFGSGDIWGSTAS